MISEKAFFVQTEIASPPLYLGDSGDDGQWDTLTRHGRPCLEHFDL